MANKVNPRILSGFMELSPSEQLKFNKMQETLKDVYESYGFYPLDTPILEISDVLLAKAGGETEKQIYRFFKGDTDISMRFDLTVPLARYVAMNYANISFPFKRYQIGKVYRGERAQKGRFREFYQSDIDIIGDSELNIINDAELPSIIYNLFINLGLDDFTIHINNRKVLTGFFQILDLENKSEDIMHVIDKLDKIGLDNVILSLKDLDINELQINKIIELVTKDGSNKDKINYLKNLSNGNEIFDKGVLELEQVINAIGSFNVPDQYYMIDLKIARGLDYYTGTVYETTYNRHPEIGSICSGGRYDNLAEYYTDKKLPGVGISIGFTRLFYILSSMNYLNDSLNRVADVLIIPMTDNIEDSIKISNQLRNLNIKTQIYFEDKKLKSKILYADRNNIPFVLFLGTDEIENNTVTIKELKTGTQTTDTLDKVSEIIKNNINQLNKDKLIKIEES